MKIDFEDLARQKSDEELLVMLQGGPAEWSRDALDAARAELHARGVEDIEQALLTSADAVQDTQKGASPDQATPVNMGMVTGIMALGLVWWGMSGFSLPGAIPFVILAGVVYRTSVRPPS